jgi:putative NADH-flavin reductase
VATTVHIDDVGVVLTVDVQRTFVGGDAAALRFIRPDGTIVERTMTPDVGLTTAKYTTVAADLAVVGGTGSLEVKVTSGTNVYHSKSADVRYLGHFEAA